MIIKVQLNSEGIMNHLEEKGIIKRLIPGRHQLHVKSGESRYDTLYVTPEIFGPHKLICVTINSERLNKMVYHNAPEEFILLDHPEAEELILVVAMCDHFELHEKVKTLTLSDSDFMAIKMIPNDPYLSFFTMMPGFAHGEICRKTSSNPPSFYVTESLHIDEVPIHLGTYQLEIERNIL